MFSDEKAAQIAAYFLAKTGQRMAYLKIIKLMYLADRESLRRYGHPLSDDRLCSLPHGPVLSATLNLLTGESESDQWSAWISAAENYEVALRREVAQRDDFDELADADLVVLDEVWRQFGHMTKYQLRDYTHQHLPEWRDPNGSSAPISYEDVFRALNQGDAADAGAEQEARQRVERMVAAAR